MHISVYAFAAAATRNDGESRCVNHDFKYKDDLPVDGISMALHIARIKPSSLRSKMIMTADPSYQQDVREPHVNADSDCHRTTDKT
jgi:hypothetical protein